MERSLSLKLGNDEHYDGEARSSFKCDECGGEFRKPLVATLTSNESVQRYYACPRCLTEVREERRPRSQPRTEASFSVKEGVKPQAKSDEHVKCEHFFGYLNKREKNSAIPEDCLVCEKMIECMVC